MLLSLRISSRALGSPHLPISVCFPRLYWDPSYDWNFTDVCVLEMYPFFTDIWQNFTVCEVYAHSPFLFPFN